MNRTPRLLTQGGTTFSDVHLGASGQKSGWHGTSSESIWWWVPLGCGGALLRWKFDWIGRSLTSDLLCLFDVFLCAQLYVCGNNWPCCHLTCLLVYFSFEQKLENFGKWRRLQQVYGNHRRSQREGEWNGKDGNRIILRVSGIGAKSMSWLSSHVWVWRSDVILDPVVPPGVVCARHMRAEEANLVMWWQHVEALALTTRGRVAQMKMLFLWSPYCPLWSPLAGDPREVCSQLTSCSWCSFSRGTCIPTLPDPSPSSRDRGVGVITTEIFSPKQWFNDHHW